MTKKVTTGKGLSESNLSLFMAKLCRATRGRFEHEKLSVNLLALEGEV